MKKLLMVIFASLLLTGCEQIVNLLEEPTAETYEKYQGKGYPGVTLEYDFQSPGQLFAYMRKNFSYKDDYDSYGVTDFWQSVDTTFAKQTGDCEDYAIFAAYHLEKMGYKVYVACITVDNKYGHAMIELDGILMEPYYYSLTEGKITSITRLSVSDCLSICFNKFGN